MILSLHSIRLDAPLNQTGESLVLTELVLPRNAIARKAALKEIRLSKGKRSLAKAPFYTAGLLKEKVEGPFGVKVNITRPLRHPEFSRLLRRLLASGLESGVDLFSPVLAMTAGGSILEDLAEEAADQLAGSISNTEPVFIAEGGLDLNSETLAGGPLTIPLRLLKSLRHSDQPPGPKSREKRRSATKLFRTGSLVGEVTLALRVG